MNTQRKVIGAHELREKVRSRLLAEAPDAAWAQARGAERQGLLRHAVARALREEGLLLPAASFSRLVQSLGDEIAGLGPLEELLREPEVTDVLVNGPGPVWVERAGRLEKTAVSFEEPREIGDLLDRILGPLGLRVDEARPWVDARLADGSRLHAIVAPLALRGPVITIRRFARRPFGMADLVARETLSPAVARFLAGCVRAGANTVVSGATGVGKTTFLNALSEAIPEGERIVTVEDSAELRLLQSHVVGLEARPPNVEGRGEVSLRDLVRNALRMRPDRIVVGEVRGGEVLDMLQAMHTGHRGCMTTVHANGPEDVPVRLETLGGMAGTLPVQVVRGLVASALDLDVHLARSTTGRKVVSVAELGPAGARVLLADVDGKLTPTGTQPASALLAKAWTDAGLAAQARPTEICPGPCPPAEVSLDAACSDGGEWHAK
ncbi:MAG: CpaF family protein [Actinomycetota bacterium]